ncbi:DUF4446 family protein [Streptomonospora wellingtoniae]|uniref:DUF4446 family protein n=1 Tax=Streptomonospora wellingtoniae TaxID=3075544 RepID=A0ABU2KXY6_9ACTN|nr:DUF4446 family protein [Streptomonospora sp. DSM 45055]MDT0303958.1 DUF4446 family protein [Streptomonospora sp. DSM 45055]
MTTLTTYLAALAAIAGVGGLALGAYALIRVRRTARDCRTMIQRLQPDGNGLDMRAVRDVAMVRYDALEEMSGARSFSLALLNAVGDGVVMTSINGRTESRTYAKSIGQGRAEEALSPEEYRAIRAARLGHRPGVPEGDDTAVHSGKGGSGSKRKQAAGDGASAGGQGAAGDRPQAGHGDGNGAPAGSDASAVRTLGTAPTGAPASGTGGAPAD